jgi:hypothetical protein
MDQCPRFGDRHYCCSDHQSNSGQKLSVLDETLRTVVYLAGSAHERLISSWVAGERFNPGTVPDCYLTRLSNR